MNACKLATLSIASIACGSGQQVSSASGDTVASESDGSGESGIADDTEGTETDTESGTDESTSSTDTDEPAPDLPPQRHCVPYAEAWSVDELCFSTKLIDPTPVHVIERTTFGPNERLVYVGGAGVHRFYDGPGLSPGQPFVELPLPGTVVQATRSPLLFGGDFRALVIATKHPHELVLLNLSDGVDIHAQLELDAAPTAFTPFILDPERGGRALALALVDADANLHVFERELDTLVHTGTRSLPEALASLDATFSWWWDFEHPGMQLLGRSSESLNAWLLNPAILGDGPIDAYPLPTEISAWSLAPLSHFGPASMLMFAQQPSELMIVKALDFLVPTYTASLAHPVDVLEGGPVPDRLGGTYALSSAASRVGLIAIHNGEATQIEPPSSWIEVPPGTVDFLPFGELEFACASASVGLAVVSSD